MISKSSLVFMTFHYRIFVVFVFDKIYFTVYDYIFEISGFNCRVRYLFDFDLKIRSGQV
jgi:hypothetical protein